MLDLPGGGRCGEVGEPELPCYGEFVEVPAGVTVRLVVDEVEWVELTGRYNVAPRQEPPTDKAGAPNPPFIRNHKAYQRDEFMPAQPVYIADQMRVRRKALVYINYTPVVYNAGRSALKAARRVRWHLEFDPPQGNPPVPCTNTDKLGAQEFAPFFDGVLDGQPAAADAPADPMPDLSTGNGADYLIITHDNFYTNILPLAQWKHAKGFKTRVVKISEISATPTCTNITAYISNAYSNWNPAPVYVLLVGDSAYIPAWYKTLHSYYSANAGTDLYYAAVDGSDYFPDLFLGRLPCASTAQCDLMVNKILNVEKTPDSTTAMYQTVLTAGQFADTDPSDGYEDRLFIETAEAVRDFYVAQGYTVPTAYCADTVITPRRYNNSNGSLLHTNGTLYGGTQTYVSTSAGTAAISNTINNGVWLVQHRDHGSQTGGWATPPFSPTRASQLGNANKLPVVMSINCETAWFDGAGDSLAEAFLKNPNGGSHAVIGATRVSYSWYNDWFTHGLYECMYTNYFETLSGIPYYKSGLTYGNNYCGHGTHLGQMLNFAKILMYEKLGAGTVTQIQFDILTLLGDPEQSPRNAVPRVLTVTHPNQLDALVPASFNVTVTAGGVPVSGALVALVLDPDEYRTAYTDASGVAPFSFAPYVSGNTNPLMSVTVSGQNSVPYTNCVTIRPDALMVMSGDGLSSTGYYGGPFILSNTVYALSNKGTSNLSWTAGCTSTWVTVSSAGGILSPGQTNLVTVSISAAANTLNVGTYGAVVNFTNVNNGRVQMRTVALNVRDGLQITPSDGLSSIGYQGGPFTPSNTVYTLSNTGTSNLSWTAGCSSNWVTVSPSGGILASGQTNLVTVSINTNANSRGAGTNTGVIVFSNVTSRTSSTRNVQLVVRPRVLVRFAWDPVAPAQYVGQPVPVRIQALDATDSLLVLFTNRVGLSGWPGSGGTNLPIGSGIKTWDHPMNTYWHDSRTQVIYLTNEVGNACSINSLALNVTKVPGQVMTNWTIRMKHTSLAGYGVSPVWETGWTTVFQTNEPIGTTGWRTFVFSTPFSYNGTNNLLIDFSHNNSSYTTAALCQCTTGSQNRAVYYYTDSGAGDPLGWPTNGYNPTRYVTSNIPNLRLGVSDPVVNMTPTNSGNFVSGVWTGAVTVLQAASNMVLRADDGNGHAGISSVFSVLTGLPDDLDNDGIPNWWEQQYFGGATNANPNEVCSNGINTVRQAYIAGLNPNDPQSRLQISDFQALTAGKVLGWNAVSGRVYSVYWTSNLLNSFQCLESNIPWTRGSFTNQTAVPCGYYRLGVQLE